MLNSTPQSDIDAELLQESAAQRTSDQFCFRKLLEESPTAHENVAHRAPIHEDLVRVLDRSGRRCVAYVRGARVWIPLARRQSRSAQVDRIDADGYKGTPELIIDLLFLQGLGPLGLQLALSVARLADYWISRLRIERLGRILALDSVRTKSLPRSEVEVACAT